MGKHNDELALFINKTLGMRNQTFCHTVGIRDEILTSMITGERAVRRSDVEAWAPFLAMDVKDLEFLIYR
jgi:hypothetical protein